MAARVLADSYNGRTGSGGIISIRIEFPAETVRVANQRASPDDSETEAFFREMLTNNLPIETVIASDFAMLDRRLAEHYEQLAKHRNSETCNRCHREIDPPGFALESFDVIGGYRERYRSIGEGDPEIKKLHGRDIWEYKLGPPLDCSGQTSAGQPFSDINEFKRLMLGEKDQVARCLTEKLMTYSTGAPVSFSDRAEVDRIVGKVMSEGGDLRTLVHEIVANELFLTK